METTCNEAFIKEYQTDLNRTLTNHPEIETTNYLDGLPKELLTKIFRLRPLSLFIPQKFGGREAETHHRLALLEASSYESIAVGLMMGINGALFLEPVT
ncbi:MAG: hypothetical protein WBW79_10255, partial [Desulfocapsaceae bacterium]